MRKKHFKFGLLMLAGLVGYFLSLSAVLVASARMSEGGGNTSKTPHLGKDDSKKLASNVRFDGKSSGAKSGFAVTGTGWSNATPCLPSKPSCDITTDHSEDGLGGDNGRSTRDSFSAGGKGGSFGSPDFSRSASYGSPFYGSGGPAFGPSADFGGNNGPSHGDKDADPAGKNKSFPDFSGPDPEISSPAPDPSLFPPKDAPDAKTPPVESAAAVPVPEPSTFWVFIASLIALIMTPGSIRRALKSRFEQGTR